MTRLAPSSSKFTLILFPEAVSSGEEVPTPFFIHVPDIGFLASIIILILVDQIHQEEQIVGQIMLLLHVDIKTMRYPVQVIFTNTTYKAVVPKFILYTLQLISQGSEGINDETLDNGEQDDNDEQEEWNVKEDSYKFIVGAIWWLNNVTNTTTSSYTLIQVEHEAGEHVMTLLIWILSFLALSNIKLSEEVESKDSVDVTHNGE